MNIDPSLVVLVDDHTNPGGVLVELPVTWETPTPEYHHVWVRIENGELLVTMDGDLMEIAEDQEAAHQARMARNLTKP